MATLASTCMAVFAFMATDPAATADSRGEAAAKTTVIHSSAAGPNQLALEVETLDIIDSFMHATPDKINAFIAKYLAECDDLAIRAAHQTKGRGA